MSSGRRDARTAILDAAWALLEERGAAVSLEQVAQAARVSRQAVYLHFGSRNVLLVAVVEHAKERAGVPHLAARVAEAKTPRELLRALAGLMAAFHPATVGASLAVEALCREDAAFAAEWSARPSGRLASARDMVQRLADAGALLVSPPARAADLAWALTGPSLYDQLVVRRGWTARAYEQHLADLLVAALIDPACADRRFAEPPASERRTKGTRDGADDRRRKRPSPARERVEPRRR